MPNSAHKIARNLPLSSALKPPRNIVGPIVRELRLKKKLTQAQFVAKLNLAGWDLSRDTFAKIESQTRWIADFEILKLADGIGIDAPELVRLAAKRQNPAEKKVA